MTVTARRAAGEPLAEKHGGQTGRIPIELPHAPTSGWIGALGCDILRPIRSPAAKMEILVKRNLS